MLGIFNTEREREVRDLTNPNLGQLTAGRILSRVTREAVGRGMEGSPLRAIAETSFNLTHGNYSRLEALKMIQRIGREIQYYRAYDAEINYLLSVCEMKIASDQGTGD